MIGYCHICNVFSRTGLSDVGDLSKIAIIPDPVSSLRWELARDPRTTGNTGVNTFLA
jgi:hypothetical protein